MLLEFYTFIKSYLPLDVNKKSVIKIDMFSMLYPTIAKDQWSNSVSFMFNRINDNIAALEEESVHCLYLINSKDYEILKFENHVPYVNCLVY
jgi:hypothetical protein